MNLTNLHIFYTFVKELLQGEGWGIKKIFLVYITCYNIKEN